MEFLPFRSGHLGFMQPQTEQRQDFEALRGSPEAALLETQLSLSAWHQGECLGAGGLIRVLPHRAVAWLLLGAASGPHLIPIVRKIKRVVAASAYVRVEMTVREGFVQGRRLMELTGAICETPQPMKYYGGDKTSEYMYTWLKEEI